MAALIVSGNMLRGLVFSHGDTRQTNVWIVHHTGEMARVSDLILDSKLDANFLPDCTVHTFQESDPNSRQRLVTRTEHWRRQRKIGVAGSVPSG
jgi:hypothetical protein